VSDRRRARRPLETGGCLAVRKPEGPDKLIVRSARSDPGRALAAADGEASGGEGDPNLSPEATGDGKKAGVSSAPSILTRLSVRGATDVGRKRDHNEDSFLVDESLRVFAVADGMGGHAGGGTASRLAVETVQSTLRAGRDSDPATYDAWTSLETSRLPDLLRQSVEAACQAIFKRAQGIPALNGMGTTLTALLVSGRNAFVAHVGDSRLYLIRKGQILQISDDHSLVNEQLKAGVITPAEARSSRFRNVITRSVGFEEEVLVDLLGLEMERGDLFVICCDGLTNLVDDSEIAAMAQSESVQDLPLRLIGLANDRGGDDNITVVALQVEDFIRAA
jgi:serine/threonine protein phosphatase PrpC